MVLSAKRRNLEKKLEDSTSRLNNILSLDLRHMIKDVPKGGSVYDKIVGSLGDAVLGRINPSGAQQD